MSLPLSSLCGSLTEEDYEYRSQHASTSLTHRRQQVRKIMNRESSLSVLATLDHTEDRNNKLSSTRTHRKAGGTRFGGLDSLQLIASSDVENHPDSEGKPTKFETKHENLKVKPLKQNQAHRIGEGWSSSLLLTATASTVHPDQADKTSESFISSSVTSSSIEQRKPVHKPSKHVQFGSSVLCQVTSSFEDENDECEVNARKSAKAACGKSSRINRKPLTKVPNDQLFNNDDIVLRKGHALKQAYTVAGKTYPKDPVHLKRGHLRRIQQQESVLLLASSTNNRGDDRSDCSCKVDDHFVSLFQNQASLNHPSKPTSLKSCSSLDDPLSKRTMLTSPSLTVHRRTKRRDRKKTPIGKIGLSNIAVDPKDQGPSKAMLEDQRMDNCATSGLDDDTASSLSDESISERWCQSSLPSSASSPVVMLPHGETFCLREIQKRETSLEPGESAQKDISSSQISENDAHENSKIRSPKSPLIDSSVVITTDNKSLIDEVLVQSEMETSFQTPEKVGHETSNILSPKSPPMDSSDAATTHYISLNNEVLMQCENASKRAESNVTYISSEQGEAMLLDDTCDIASKPSECRSMNDVDPGSVKNAIRRSRRVRVATDRYLPNTSKVSDPIPEASSSIRMLKPDQNKQGTDTQPSKSMILKDNSKVSQEVFPSSASSRVLPTETFGKGDEESACVYSELSAQDIYIKDDTTIEQKPVRDRKPTDFFHYHIQEFLPTKHPTFQGEPKAELTSTKGTLPPKVLNSRAIPHRPPTGKIASPFVEDLSATEQLNGWTVDEIQQLRDGHLQVDPTSSSFWSEIANTLHNRTAAECQSQWFSLAKTPAPKSRKIHSKLGYHHDDENDDDIFQSTPMRENVYPSSSISNHPPLNGSGIFPAIPLIEKTAKAYNDSGVKQEFVRDSAKPFSKAFLQRMRKDHAKAEKGVQLGARANKGLYRAQSNQVLSEVIHDSDIDINIRLTPGGTLKVKSHIEDDDFWDEVYDDEDDDIDAIG
jgi:Myb-like DNA-binding domain